MDKREILKGLLSNDYKVIQKIKNLKNEAKQVFKIGNQVIVFNTTKKQSYETGNGQTIHF